MDPVPYASSIGDDIRYHQHFSTPITLHGRSLLWLILRTRSTTIPNNAISKTDLWKTFASNFVLLSIKKKLVISKGCVNQDPLEPQQIFLFEQTEYIVYLNSSTHQITKCPQHTVTVLLNRHMETNRNNPRTRNVTVISSTLLINTLLLIWVTSMHPTRLNNKLLLVQC